MRLIKAIKFASEKHKSQKRKATGVPYFEHPVIVSSLIAKYKGDSKALEDLQISALLHDSIEDTSATYSEIEYEFGPLVASIVMELTSDNRKIKEIGKNEYLKEKMIHMSKYAFILKLLDRYSNILDNPTNYYITDTQVLLNHLLVNRKDLSKRQIRIINDTLEECGKYVSH